MRRWIGILSGWLLSVLIAAILGTAIQVHLNAEAIVALGAPVPIGERLGMLGHDLLNFAPAYAGLVAAAYVVAWPIAGGLARWRPAARPILFPLAGAAAIAVMLWAMQLALPITAIAAARTTLGVVGLCAAGALAGWLYVAIRPGQKSSSA